MAWLLSLKNNNNKAWCVCVVAVFCFCCCYIRFCCLLVYFVLFIFLFIQLGHLFNFCFYFISAISIKPQVNACRVWGTLCYSSGCFFLRSRLVKSESKRMYGNEMSNIAETQLTYKCIRLMWIGFCVTKSLCYRFHNGTRHLNVWKIYTYRAKPVSILYTLCFYAASWYTQIA